MDLFGHVGQVEVDGEGSHQEDGVGHVGVVEKIVELGVDPFLQGRAVGVVLAEVAGQGADPLHGIQQIFAVLANQRATQLGPQASNIGPQRSVGRFGPPVRCD